MFQAAIIIQAWWRSYLTRKRIKKAGSAIGKFQRSFRWTSSSNQLSSRISLRYEVHVSIWMVFSTCRSRKELEEQQKEETRLQSELQHMLLVQRAQHMRELRSRELKALEIIPAGLPSPSFLFSLHSFQASSILSSGELSKHQEKVQNESATKIQALFRGHRVRSSVCSKKDSMRQMKAAVVIQRAVRVILHSLFRMQFKGPNVMLDVTGEKMDEENRDETEGTTQLAASSWSDRRTPCWATGED